MNKQMAEEEETLSPGEPDKEEESPYLRRQKSVAVRRNRVDRRWRWVILWGGVAAPVAVAACLLANFALSSPRFVLRSADDVLVTGIHFVSRDEVLNALGLPLHAGAAASGANVFRLSLEAKREQVESIAWVRSATLMRVLPGRLLVQVVERTPVAFANVDGRVSLVDDEGTLLDKPENSSFDFPVISGLDAAKNPEERRARMALYLEFARQLGEEIPRSGWLVSEADLTDPDDLTTLLVQGHDTLQVHFGHENFTERFHTFLSLLPELHKSNAQIDSVDLRYRNQVVVNPHAASASAPAADAGESKTLKE
jgi:cell division protein FtsQ